MEVGTHVSLCVCVVGGGGMILKKRDVKSSGTSESHHQHGRVEICLRGKNIGPLYSSIAIRHQVAVTSVTARPWVQR